MTSILADVRRLLSSEALKLRRRAFFSMNSSLIRSHLVFLSVLAYFASVASVIWLSRNVLPTSFGRGASATVFWFVHVLVTQVFCKFGTSWSCRFGGLSQDGGSFRWIWLLVALGPSTTVLVLSGDLDWDLYGQDFSLLFKKIRYLIRKDGHRRRIDMFMKIRETITRSNTIFFFSCVVTFVLLAYLLY